MGLDDQPSAVELDDYRRDARSWLADNMPPLDPMANPNEQSAELLKDLAPLKTGLKGTKGGGGVGVEQFLDLGPGHGV